MDLYSEWDHLMWSSGFTDDDLLETIYSYMFGSCATHVDEQDDSTRASIVLLVAFHRGTNVTRLARLTGYPPNFIQQLADRMTKSGIWRGDAVDCEHWKHGGLADLALDVSVALGEFERLNKKKNGKYVYRLIETPGEPNPATSLG
jgi:hypothetical protein